MSASSKKRIKVALIDANALIHRAYHALPPMTSADGHPTNAAYGFTTMLLKMFSTVKPTHVVAAFDMKGPTFRHEKFADYKGHRKAPDSELAAQFDTVRDIVAAFGIPVIQKKGFEADDIIGTLVTELNGNMQKVIVTGDKDTLQLIDDHTSVFTLKRGVTDTITYTADTVREEFGFEPAAIPDYKGLRGDPSDNIPGVVGIGDKGAKDLLATYATVEEIYEHIEDVPTRLQSKLVKGKKDALLSKDLAIIKRDVPIKFELDNAVAGNYNGQEVITIFTDLGFRSLLRRLPGDAGGQPTLLSAAAAALPSVGSKKADAEHESFPEHYHLVTTDQDKRKLQKDIQKTKLIAFDTETDALGARLSPIVGMSFAFKKDGKIQAYYVPVTRKSVTEWSDVLEDPTIEKTGHNLKYDFEVLQQAGVTLQGIAFDSMIAGYLLRPGSRQYGLDAMALEELGYRCIPITDLIGEGKNQKLVSEVPIKTLARYACEDAEISYLLYEKLEPRIRKEGLLRVLGDIEIPLIRVLSSIELGGVAVDAKVLNSLNTKVTRRINVLKKNIFKESGEEFNINSTQQLRRVLFENLKLPTDGIKRTQSGFSTAASELEKLHSLHPVISLLEEYRELTKLLNTYIETLPHLIEKDTSRIFAEFNQVVAATGRLSSQNPNLQNIPVRTDLGQEIRAAFIAPKGRKLIKADYSQVELRLAAHMSQDEKMLDVFRANQDIHRATAAWVFGIEQEDVTDTQRREAKTLNFGVLYGMGAQAFARAASISLEEARSFIARYHKQYAGLTAYIDETVEYAATRGYVETLFGRKRYIPEIESNNPQVRAGAERIAFNFPLQGTAADILKKAMINLYEVIQQDFPSVQIVLTVHDELVCEVDENEAEGFAQVMRNVMENVITLDIPLMVDIGIGDNWQNITEIVAASPT